MTTTIEERFNVLKERMREREIEVYAHKAKHESSLERLNKLSEDLLAMEVVETNHILAIEEFKRISNERTESAKEVLEGVLNWVLDNINLAQNYSARLEETNHGRNGKGLLIILIDRDTGYERSVSEQSGTALAQIISFLMSVIVIKFSGASRLMVIDEVFSGIDDHRTVTMFGQILVALAENENFQFMMVEHQEILDEIEGMNVVQLGLTDYEDGTVVLEQYKKTLEEDEEDEVDEVTENDESTIL